MAQDIPADKAQQVFFVDDDLIERLLRRDPTPLSPKPQRPAYSSSLAPAIELASEGKLDDAVRELEGGLQRGENAAEVHSGLGHLRFDERVAYAGPDRDPVVLGDDLGDGAARDQVVDDGGARLVSQLAGRDERGEH